MTPRRAHRSRASAALTTAIALGLGTALALSACSSGSVAPVETLSPAPAASPSADLAGFYAQKLEWTACRGAFQCADAVVPLDYANPTGASIKIKMLKVAASDPVKRLGTMFVNPGGPGGSGRGYAASAGESFSADLRAHYDIVGFDPRGVGASSPIECMDDAQTDRFYSGMGTPHNDAQLANVIEISEQFGVTCEKNSPSLVAYVGTVPAVRDLDILRSAVGEPTLNLLGKSYGTFMGLTYAELFPSQVGRMVLDGVLDPASSGNDVAKGQAKGFQLALSRFIAACPAKKDCPLPKKPKAALAAIQKFLASVATGPMKVTNGRKTRDLTQPLAIMGLFGSMYYPPDGWPALRAALGSAMAGDGAQMLELADIYASRKSNGTYADNSADALYAVSCLDHNDTNTVDQTKQFAAQWAVFAPTFGSDLAWGNLPCTNWPAPATDKAHPIAATGAAPILLVGTVYDPATPYDWAVSVSQQLTSNSLITYNGDGHTAYKQGSACVDTKVDAFMITGILPPKDTRC